MDYDRYGVGYATVRRADPRIAAQVHAALGPAETVVNVGAGGGSYEPGDRRVLAVEPSATMRAQRPPGAAPVVAAVAEALPLRTTSVDAAMAMSTVHQWPDLRRGLREMRRVARGAAVVLTFDQHARSDLWVFEYVPEIARTDQVRMPRIEELADGLGGSVRVETVPVPLDCTDGFVEAFYGRPEALLDPGVRRAQSAWAFVSPEVVARFVAELSANLASGAWDERYGHLRTQPTYDGPVRLVVSTP